MTKKRPVVKRSKPKARRTKPTAADFSAAEISGLRAENAGLQAEILRLRGVIDEIGAKPAPKAIGEIVTDHHLSARLTNLEAEIAKLK